MIVAEFHGFVLIAAWIDCDSWCRLGSRQEVAPMLTGGLVGSDSGHLEPVCCYNVTALQM